MPRAAGMPFSPCRRWDGHAQAMRPGGFQNGSSASSPAFDGNESSRIECNQLGSRSSPNTRRTSASGKSTPRKCSSRNLRSRSRRSSASISRSTYALTEPARRPIALARLSARLESERLSLCCVIPRAYYASARAARRVARLDVFGRVLPRRSSPCALSQERVPNAGVPARAGG
jgi:hypothetical protein